MRQVVLAPDETAAPGPVSEVAAAARRPAVKQPVQGPRPAAARPRAPAPAAPPDASAAAAARPAPEVPAEGPAAVASAPETPATATPPPRYATRLPPSQRLHFVLDRGAQPGRATLDWQQGEDGYRLSLEGDFGRDRAGRSSRGALDTDGIAPERYVETRRGREQRAVNFQRDKALITFSAATQGRPLWPAAQDRLSWLVQLAAALEADAALRETGRVLQLFVAGPRGEAETWAFEVLGRETLALPAGAVADALHLRREPTRPWEPQTDLWLDPARHHLPVRLRWRVRPTGETTDLRLALPPTDAVP
ncbi:MAG: DUF3108 domain-containing protein [Rubrivivax sp.]|nr:DUF3108 domain-containing protein [Rubrivivax sp.]